VRVDDLRLFSIADVLEMRHPVADAALWVAHFRPLPCLLCDQLVGNRVAYVVILTPADTTVPPHSTAICQGCADGEDRADIERRTREMTVLHAYTAGNA
jgi:hypothetical protein